MKFHCKHELHTGFLDQLTAFCLHIMQMHISVADDNFGMHALDSTVWYRFSSHFE